MCKRYESVRFIDTEEAEIRERISPRDTKGTENLCVSVSPWLIDPR